MTVYIAHNYGAREMLKSLVIPAIESKGLKVSSRWILEDMSTCPRLTCANADIADLRKADILLFFSSDYNSKPGRGKHVELGYALALDKIVVLVGENFDACVFYSLPEIVTFSNLELALKFLGGINGTRMVPENRS